MSDIDRIQEEASKYAKLEDLMRQDGWPILLNELSRISKVLMEALLVEKDYNKIITLQERYRAFSSVIQILQSSTSIKDKLYQDLHEILADEKLKQEFDI